MRINYELQDLDLSAREQIEKDLRRAQIPYLLENDQLLVHKMDERAVDRIIGQLGTIHNPGASPSTEKSPEVPTPVRGNNDRPLPRSKMATQPIISNSNHRHAPTVPVRRQQSSGIFTLAGGAIGVILGILLVVAQFQDQNQDGPIYIFLPALILGCVGLFVGSLVEKAIENLKRN